MKRWMFLAVLFGLVSLFMCPWVMAGSKTLMGAGATFPYPLYSKYFDVYYHETGVKVNYQAIGSGGGIRQLEAKTVDFGASDAFMSDEELREAYEKTHGKILHIPTCLGAVVITYHLPGNPTLRLTPDVIADIFLGKIKKWNDKRIAQLNPAVSLPNMNIVVVHRAEASGTTFIFTDYLSKVNREWKEKVGRGKVVPWPTGLAGKGNPGVAGLVRQVPGSVGYVELIYAKENGMPVALIRNKAGRFIKPSLKSVSLAANINLPADTRVSITNTSAPKGYPISSFTWLIFYKEQHYNGRSKERALRLAKLLWWIEHEGQRYNESLLYGRLPRAAVKRAEAIIRSMTYDGKRLVTW